jgi:hypothetical protein
MNSKITILFAIFALFASTISAQNLRPDIATSGELANTDANNMLFGTNEEEMNFESMEEGEFSNEEGEFSNEEGEFLNEENELGLANLGF